MPFRGDSRLRSSFRFHALPLHFDSYSYPCFSPLFLLCSPRSRSVRGYSAATLFFANPYLGRAKHRIAAPSRVCSIQFVAISKRSPSRRRIATPSRRSVRCRSFPSLIAVGGITPPYSRRSRCRCRSVPPTRTFLCRMNATAQARAGFHSRGTRAQPSQDRPSTSRW